MGLGVRFPIGLAHFGLGAHRARTSLNNDQSLWNLEELRLDSKVVLPASSPPRTSQGQREFGATKSISSSRTMPSERNRSIWSLIIFWLKNWKCVVSKERVGGETRDDLLVAGGGSG
jgi:hypothetical protein